MDWIGEQESLRRCARIAPSIFYDCLRWSTISPIALHYRSTASDKKTPMLVGAQDPLVVVTPYVYRGIGVHQILTGTPYVLTSYLSQIWKSTRLQGCKHT
jgi:hypothetical protein